MWIELIKKISNDCEFNPPATHAQILMAQKKLNITFPDDLKNCLMESNGVTNEFGLGLIWPTERIISENLEFRNNKDFRDLYMPFDSLLFFADAKNGNRVDAIEISLDHSSADAVTCYLPYSIDRFNRFEPGELFAITKPVESFFKPIEL